MSRMRFRDSSVLWLVFVICCVVLNTLGRFVVVDLSKREPVAKLRPVRHVENVLIRHSPTYCDIAFSIFQTPTLLVAEKPVFSVPAFSWFSSGSHSSEIKFGMIPLKQISDHRLIQDRKSTR